MPAARHLLTLGLMMTLAHPGHTAPTDALATGSLGLHDAVRFRAVKGDCDGCAAPPQALWYFQDDWIAVPHAQASGFDPTLAAQDDVRTWAQTHAPRIDTTFPPVIWLGSPHVAADVRFDTNGQMLLAGNSPTLTFSLVPQRASNMSWFNADSLAWLEGQSLTVRGTQTDGRFAVRTIWPHGFDIDLAALAIEPLRDGETLATLVRADEGGARRPASARLLWERAPGAARLAAGKPVFALMLNGAQGDDDEAHGGHFAVATGVLGETGEWNSWLVNNFYNLDAWSEKGIIAATLPMDAYLTDLNGGQAWYRPSAVLVAVLREQRAAALVQQGMDRVFSHFYRHDFSYRHASANCAGISLDTLRSLGWTIPLLGPTSKLKAWLGLPYMALKNMSLDSGLQAFDYMSTERSGLLPFVAFNVAGSDLLGRLTAGKAAEQGLERLLADDVEALIYIHVPQIPSSRAFGRAPVSSYDEYASRVPADRSQWIVRPAPPRPFPDALRDPSAPKEAPPASRRALIVWLVALGGAALWLLTRLFRR
jgi:hypothetical protein